MLELPWGQACFSLSAIVLMTLGLNTMALGLGGIFPNFQEPSPAKIVSGFGGTVCLILSFIYILVGNLCIMLPSASRLKLQLPSSLAFLQAAPVPFSLLGLFVLTAALGLMPYLFALKRMKNLDYFGKV
jgi:ABC-2 type transport system permease protein